MSRAIKREPKSPICVLGIGIKIMIKLFRIKSYLFLVVESHCLQLQNAGKHIPATIEFQNFPGEHALDPPRGTRPSGPCQFFARVSNSVALLFKTLMNPLNAWNDLQYL